MVPLTPETACLLAEAAADHIKGLSPFEKSLEEAGVATPDPLSMALIPPIFDLSESALDSVLDDALTIAARESEEADAATTPLPPPPPPSSAPLPSPASTVSESDLAKATQALFNISPGAPITRGRNQPGSLKRPLNNAAAQRHRSLTQKKAKTGAESPQQRQPKLDDKYFKEYAMNAQRLFTAGVSQEDQVELEKGLDDRGIIKMQRKRLAELGPRKNVSIAPKPVLDVTKKGGPSK